jgi:hypothetical protein
VGFLWDGVDPDRHTSSVGIAQGLGSSEAFRERFRLRISGGCWLQRLCAQRQISRPPDITGEPRAMRFIELLVAPRTVELRPVTTWRRTHRDGQEWPFCALPATWQGEDLGSPIDSIPSHHPVDSDIHCPEVEDSGLR